MAIKDDIIQSLSVNQKINFLILKLERKVKIFNVILEEEQVKKLSSTMDLRDVFNKNGQKITMQVVEQFMLEVFKNITTFSSSGESENVLKIKNVISANDAIEAYSNGIQITTSIDKRSIKEELEKKYLESLKVREEVVSGNVTKADYEAMAKRGEIFTIEMINEKVEQILSFVLPIIHQAVKRYEVKKVKKENQVNRKSISPKLKLIILLVFALYYNAVSLFIYNVRYKNEVSEQVTIGLLIIVNIIFLVLLLRCIPKKQKNKTNKYVEMIEDFELVIPSKSKISTTRKSIFGDTVDLKELCDNFYLFLVSKGMLLEHKKIRELFSSMASNKLVVIRNTSYTDLKFLKAFNEFLGNETYYEVANKNMESEQELIWINKHGQATTSDFINGICEASKHSNNVNVAALTEVDLEKCNLYLGSILNFVRNPNEKGSIRIDMVKEAPISQYMTNGKLPIPKNMWFLLFLNEESIYKLPKNLVEDTILLEIDIKDVDSKEYTKELKALSYTGFVDAITKAKEENFIPDELWSKIDEFEELMNNKYNYSIANNTVRKMENYASSYNVCGEDESVSVDSSIANILLGFIFNENFIDEESHKVITSMLTEVFDDIVITKEALNKYK